MFVSLLLFTTMVLSLVPVQGAPGGKASTARSSSPLKNVIMKVDPLKNESGHYHAITIKDHPVTFHSNPIAPKESLSMVVLPEVNENMRVDEIGRKWKESKSQYRNALASTKVMLANAGKGNRPTVSLVIGRQRELKKSYANLEGWHLYFTSPEGKRADPEDRRADSAHHRSLHTEKLHKEADALLAGNIDNRWHLVAADIPINTFKIDNLYREVAHDKKAKYRTKYGDFVKHIENGGKAEDVKFVSSLQAKALQESDETSKSI